MSALIWYNKSATDDRVWCVRRGEETVRCLRATFAHGSTAFSPAGFSELQPGGPRGVIQAEGVETIDEVPL